MLARLLSGLFGFTALTALVATGILYYRTSGEATEPGLVVEEPDRVLTGLVPDREYVLDYRVVNGTDQAIRVIGAPPDC